MNKILPFIAILGSLTLSNAHGNETAHKSINSIYSKNAHHIYFGPVTFWFDINTHVKDVKIDDNKFFLGLNLGYEYLKPKAFYASIDLVSAGSNQGFRAIYKGYKLHRDHGLSGFGNIDVSFGYTFAPKIGLITPFVGLGGYTFGNGNHHFGFKESMGYASLGMRSQYEITKTLNTGLNVKIFPTFSTTKHYKHRGLNRSEHDNIWGGEISIPFAWHIGTTRRWDIQLEPYFLKIGFSEIQNIYGLQLLFGYRF
jgi:hypothetical protein